MTSRNYSMETGLALGVIAAVVIGCGLGAYFYSQHHYNALLDSARSTALAQSQMIRVALEHQMMENDRNLIAEIVASFGRERGIQQVVLTDREGHSRYSSGVMEGRADLDADSPTCTSCHQ